MGLTNMESSIRTIKMLMSQDNGSGVRLSIKQVNTGSNIYNISVILNKGCYFEVVKYASSGKCIGSSIVTATLYGISYDRANIGWKSLPKSVSKYILDFYKELARNGIVYEPVN